MATWTKAHDFLQRGSGVRSPVCPKFQIVATKPFRSGLLIGGEVILCLAGWRPGKVLGGLCMFTGVSSALQYKGLAGHLDVHLLAEELVQVDRCQVPARFLKASIRV